MTDEEFREPRRFASAFAESSRAAARADSRPHRCGRKPLRSQPMGYTIDWGSAEVEEGELSVPVQPDPDFAFLTVFDMVLIETPPPPGAAAWGQVQFAGGRIVVSEVQPGSAPALG